MKQKLLENLDRLFQENCEGISPLQKAIRQQAWKRFTELGVADKHIAGYQYFPLSQFYQQSYALANLPEVTKDQYYSLIYPECRNSYFIFINGQYVPELSHTSALPKEVVVLKLKDALQNYGNFLQTRLSKALKEESDPFATLNIAMIQMGLFLYVPPKMNLEAPIQCLHIISNDRSAIFNPRIHFFLGKESKVDFVYDHVCLKDFDYFSNSVVDIALEEGAQLHQYGVINPCQHGFCFDSFRVTQKQESIFKSLTCTSGTRSVKQDFHIALMGENASCDLKGIALLKEGRQSHVNVLIDHAAPNCTSNQLFKNVLWDHSKASFEGKIRVQPIAQKTKAYQLNKNLLLGEKASTNSKPNLEIFADDVKASHGATITKLNDDHLNYLRSRGIDAKSAKKLLLFGFTTEIIQNAPCFAMRDRMMQIAEKNSA